MRFKLNVLLAPLFSASLVACSGSNDTDATEPGMNDNGMTENVSGESNAARYLGSFRTDCIIDGDDDPDYFVFGFDFTPTEFTYRFASYLDEACTTQISATGASTTTTVNGTYLNNGSQTTMTGLTADLLTLNLLSASRQIEEVNGSASPVIELTEADVPFLNQSVDLQVYIDDSEVLYVSKLFIFGPGSGSQDINLEFPFRKQ